MKPILKIQCSFLLIFTINTATFAQDHLQFFLSSLRQNSLDSTTEIKQYYNNGTVQNLTSIMHSHHYAFGTQKEKFLRQTFIKTTKHYDKSGILQKCDSLAPPEQGYYYEKYYYPTGRMKRVIIFESRGSSRSGKRDTDLPPPGFIKIKEYSIDINGKKTVEYALNEPVKYLIDKSGYYYHFTSKIYAVNLVHNVNLQYATFEAREKYLEVRIRNGSDDAILCTLKFYYSNGLLNTKSENDVREFIIKNIYVFTDIPRIALYDNKEEKLFILDYNFNKVFKEPIRDIDVLKPVSRNNYYFWLCNDKCGLYDLDGKNIIPPKHELVYPEGDFLKITTDRLHACFDYHGNVVIPYNEDFGAFTVSDNNIAHVYNQFYFPEATGVSYVNLVTKDTMKFTSGLPFHGNFATAWEGRNKGVIDRKGDWVVKPHFLINGIEITTDSLIFMELQNPKFYNLTGDDRQYWYQKYVMQFPDSLQKKTDLLKRHPDFDPRDYIYVLYNIKTKKADTLKINSKAFDGIHAYSLSLESDEFVNGYATLKVSGYGKTLNWFYSFLSIDGSVVNVKQQYGKVRDVNSRGLAIVTLNTTTSDSKKKEVEGVISTAGEEVIPCEFFSCREIKFGYIVYSGGNWGLIGFDGEVLIRPNYPYHAIETMIMQSINPF